MHVPSLAGLTDAALDQALSRAALHESGSTAHVLLHIAEFDARELYVSAGFARMQEYCVRRLHYSEDAAAKRVTIARATRQFPQLLIAIGENRLHLSGAKLLLPYLTPENVGELIGLATHKSRSEIEELLLSRRRALTLELVSASTSMSADETQRDDLPPAESARSMLGSHGPRGL